MEQNQDLFERAGQELARAAFEGLKMTDDAREICRDILHITDPSRNSCGREF